MRPSQRKTRRRCGPRVSNCLSASGGGLLFAALCFGFWCCFAFCTFFAILVLVVCGYGSGDYLQGQPKEAANFLEPYLRFLLGFIGIEDVQVVSVQSTTADADTVTRNMDQARADLALMI